MSSEYSKGYRAGLARAKRLKTQKHLDAQRQAMMDRLFVALLPVAMAVEGWTIGNEKVHTSSQRVELARLWVFKAIRNRPTIMEL